MTLAMRLLTGLLLAISVAAAHGHGADGREPDMFLNKETATLRGEAILDAMITNKQLSDTWTQKTLAGIEVETNPKGGELWIVSFSNPAEPDPAKQTLFIFVNETGAFVGANYSGK